MKNDKNTSLSIIVFIFSIFTHPVFAALNCVAPTASITSSNSGTVGQAMSIIGVVFDQYNDTLRVTWNYGDGHVSSEILVTTNGNTPVSTQHTYATAGNYTVKLTATDSGGRSATAIKSVAVLSKFIVDIGGDYFVGINKPLLLYHNITGNSNTATYKWSFGNGATSNLENPVYSYSAVGEYPLTLTVTDGANIQTDTTVVYVDSVDQSENLGNQKELNGDICLSSTLIGNPINAATGNKFLSDIDFQRFDDNYMPFKFERFYNSMGGGRDVGFGPNWSHTFSRSLVQLSPTEMLAYRHDGSIIRFNNVGGVWVPPKGTSSELIEASYGWELKINGNISEIYNKSEKLLTHIIDRRYQQKYEILYKSLFGVTHISEVRDADLGSLKIVYRYNERADKSTIQTLSWHPIDKGQGRYINATTVAIYFHSYYNLLSYVQKIFRNDTRVVITYKYEDAKFPNAITRIGVTSRQKTYATYTYDPITGKATSSRLGDGVDAIDVDLVDITYNTNGSVDILDALGESRTYNFDSIDGKLKLGSVANGKSCNVCGIDVSNITYDAATGYADLVTDKNGNITDYDYNARGLVGRKIEALGTPEERTIGTQWDPEYDIPVCIVEPSRTTAITYTKVLSSPISVNGGTFTSDKITSSTKIVFDTHDTAQFPTLESKQCQSIVNNANYANLTKKISTTRYGPMGIDLVDGPREDVDDSVSITTTWESSGSYGANVKDRRIQTILPNSALEEVMVKSFRTSNVDVFGLPLDVKYGDTGLDNYNYTYRYGTFGRVTNQTTKDADGEIYKDIEYSHYSSSKGLLRSIVVQGLVSEYTSVMSYSGTRYFYDSAERLKSTRDDAFDGNVPTNLIEYALDPVGNITQTDTYDTNSLLTFSSSATYNTLNQLTQTNSNAVTVDYTGYDNMDNLKESILGGLTTANTYDGLNRIRTITQTATTGEIYQTKLDYNSDDQLTSVTDPLLHETTYKYDGFGNMMLKTSPDTGVTKYTHLDLSGNEVSAYDGAGNLLSSTDANSVKVDYTYDSRNRMTDALYSDGSSITNDYNTPTIIDNPRCKYFPGGLQRTTITDKNTNSAVTEWCLNSLGYVLGKRQTIDNITVEESYQYNLMGYLIGVTTVSGRQIDIKRNKHGDISDILVDNTTVIGGITYEPFGPAKEWNWYDTDGITPTMVRTKNYSTATVVNGKLQNYALSLLSGGDIFSHSMSHEITNTGNIKDIKDLLSGSNKRYIYDDKLQLTDYISPKKALGYRYDLNGNRLTYTKNGQTTQSIIDPLSNKLDSVGAAIYRYDNAGNLLNDGRHSYAYDNRGQLTTVDNGRTQYFHNSLGERIKKTKSDGTIRYYFYNENGELTAELDETGQVVAEYIYLNGEPVIAFLQKKVGPCFVPIMLDGITIIIPILGHCPQGPYDNTLNMLYIHTDHLGAPIALTEPAGVVVWKAEYDPFGMANVSVDPDQDWNSYEFNMRFPGQYFDSETGLHYNYFRYYDPATGRYITSDPIGLQGGLNTYGYVGGNPANWIDPYGLAPWWQKAMRAAGLAAWLSSGQAIKGEKPPPGPSREQVQRIEEARDKKGKWEKFKKIFKGFKPPALPVILCPLCDTVFGDQNDQLLQCKA